MSLSPVGGIDILIRPRRGHAHCQWVKGDSIYDIDTRTT